MYHQRLPHPGTILVEEQVLQVLLLFHQLQDPAGDPDDGHLAAVAVDHGEHTIGEPTSCEHLLIHHYYVHPHLVVHQLERDLGAQCDQKHQQRYDE